MTKQPIDLKAKALNLLSRRDYAYKELWDKLQKYSENLELIKQVLDEMVVKGFLNEERFIENFIHSKSHKYGSQKIKYLLNHKTSNPGLINQVYQTNETDEIALARKIRERKFGEMLPESTKDKTRQIRFLLGRGFCMTIIQQVFKSNGCLE